MRSMIIKMVLLSLVLFVGKAAAFAQDTDINCEISGLDFNMSGDDPGYFINFGSFSLFADGEKSREEEGIVGIFKYYKLPRTKLILNVIAYTLKDELLGDQLSMSMILGRKRISITSIKLDEEGVLKDAVSAANTWHPMEDFDKGGEGKLSTGFLGKKKPVAIIMLCKKVKKGR